MPERIISRARPAATPATPTKGRILMRVDPASIGRFTRIDLRKHGYHVTSVRTLTPEVVAHQDPATILFFHHTDEPLPLDTLQTLPQDVPVILAIVGDRPPERHLVDFARSRGYAVLSSQLGPNLHIVLRILTQLPRHLN